MFFEVLRLTYHIPITIESLTYRVLLGVLQYSYLFSGRLPRSLKRRECHFLL